METELDARALTEWACGLVDKRIAAYDARRKRALAHTLDGEALHEVRTSARRLRSALEDLGPLVEHSPTNLRRVKKIGDATGEARDLAVLLARLAGYRELAGKGERAEIDALAADLRRRERRALRACKGALRHCRSPKRP